MSGTVASFEGGYLSVGKNFVVVGTATDSIFMRKADGAFDRTVGMFIDSCVVGTYNLYSRTSRMLASYVEEMRVDIAADFEVTRCYLKHALLGGVFAIPSSTFHHFTVEAVNISAPAGSGPFSNNNLIGEAPMQLTASMTGNTISAVTIGVPTPRRKWI